MGTSFWRSLRHLWSQSKICWGFYTFRKWGRTAKKLEKRDFQRIPCPFCLRRGAGSGDDATYRVGNKPSLVLGVHDKKLEAQLAWVAVSSLCSVYLQQYHSISFPHCLHVQFLWTRLDPVELSSALHLAHFAPKFKRNLMAGYGRTQVGLKWFTLLFSQLNVMDEWNSFMELTASELSSFGLTLCFTASLDWDGVQNSLMCQWIIGFCLCWANLTGKTLRTESDGHLQTPIIQKHGKVQEQQMNDTENAFILWATQLLVNILVIRTKTLVYVQRGTNMDVYIGWTLGVLDMKKQKSVLAWLSASVSSFLSTAWDGNAQIVDKHFDHQKERWGAFFTVVTASSGALLHSVRITPSCFVLYPLVE